MLGCPLKTEAHYPNSFYMLVEGPTYNKWVTQTSMGYAVINLRNPYMGYADFIIPAGLVTALYNQCLADIPRLDAILRMEIL